MMQADPATNPDPIQDDPPSRAGGNMKVTREDWLRAAMDILIDRGVAEVKVLTIGEHLGVSRSSFYWYFKSRRDLLDSLITEWQNTNTGVLVQHAAMPAGTITAAVCNLFRCFVDPSLFNHRLDFAMREWARRDMQVRQAIDSSDVRRRLAIAEMFERYGYSAKEADVRARILYFMQIGYYALDLSESLEERLSRTEGYLLGFTGQHPRPEEVAALYDFVRRLQQT